MKSKISSSILILCLTVLLTTGCTGTYSESPAHLEINNLQQIWAVDIGEAIEWPPVIIKDTLVIMPAASPLMALEAENGQIDWQLDTPAVFWGDSLSATLDDVLLAGEHGRLIALSPKSGIAEWEINLDGDVLTPPYLDRYVLFTSANEIEGSPIKNGTLYAINAATGKTLWLYKTGSKDLLTPARGNDMVFVAGNSGKAGTVYAISAAEGLLQWESSLDDQIISICAQDEFLIALTDQGAILGLDTQTGDQLWKQETQNSSHHLLGWNDLFVIIGENNLEARDGQTGTLIWHFEEDQNIIDQITIDDKIILLNNAGELISLDIADGKEIGRFVTSSSTPKGMASHQNWLYLVDSTGTVFGYKSP